MYASVNDSLDINNSRSKRVLNWAATSWYCSAVIGLSAFLIYLVMHYGGRAVGMSNQPTESSFVAGDTIGNAFLIVHIGLALLVVGGGLLQLLPALRLRYPAFHRYNGRVFVCSALICSLAGQYLIFTREIPGDLIMDLGTSASGVLVWVFSFLAVTAARRGAIVQHRQWALRLFMVANAVWFFRIGLMFWLVVNQGPVGIDMETFTGPAITFIAYAQFLLPLAVLELYFWAQRSRTGLVKYMVASLIFVASFTTLAGVGAASMMMWFP